MSDVRRFLSSWTVRTVSQKEPFYHTKPKDSNCSLFECAATAFWLCRVELSESISELWSQLSTYSLCWVTNGLVIMNTLQGVHSTPSVTGQLRQWTPSVDLTPDQCWPNVSVVGLPGGMSLKKTIHTIELKINPWSVLQTAVTAYFPINQLTLLAFRDEYTWKLVVLFWRWPTVYDACPTINQHWINVFWLLGKGYSQTRDIEPMIDWRWSAVCDVCLRLIQYWLSVQLQTTGRWHTVLHVFFKKGPSLPEIFSWLSRWKLHPAICG